MNGKFFDDFFFFDRRKDFIDKRIRLDLLIYTSSLMEEEENFSLIKERKVTNA